jgi:hypothetical protein
MIFTYTDAGDREPFDPQATGAHLQGCILCGRRVASVGIFIPQTPEMQAVVLVLRQHEAPRDSTAGLVYGLCRKHGRQDVSTRVKAVLVATSRKVTVQ